MNKILIAIILSYGFVAHNSLASEVRTHSDFCRQSNVKGHDVDEILSEIIITGGKEAEKGFTMSLA